MRAAVVLGAPGMSLAVLLARWCLRHVDTRRIEQRIEGLCAQVASWQAAHDHQVESMDRRLRHVEESAARAENEARMVSVQLAGMDRALVARFDQVEHRLSRGGSWRGAGRGCACSIAASHAVCAVGAVGMASGAVAGGPAGAGTVVTAGGVGSGVAAGAGVGAGL